MADLVLGLAKSTVEGTLTLAKTAIEEEKKLQKSVQLDLMLISDEFEMMHSFLNARKDHVTDDVAKTVVRQVRNMALDMEDCIESVVILDGKSNWWRRMLPSCVPAAASVADLDAAVADIEQLKARVEAMGQRNSRYSSIVGDCSSKPVEEHTHKQAGSNATVPNILVMAREASKKKSRQVDLAMLINKKDRQPWREEEEKEDDDDEEEEEVEEEGEALGLVHSSPLSTAGGVLELQVISVLGTRDDVGMISIKEAYDNPETCSNFRCRAWVKLMHPFHPHEFIRSLLAQFYKNYSPQNENTVDVLKAATEVMEVTDGVLIEEFQRLVSNHKYLVVLEDVSSMVDWEAVRIYLPDTNNGSCIVVHTQQVAIARLCVGHPNRVLELKRFAADHSVYVLFKEDVTGNVEEATADIKLKTARKWLDRHQPVVGRDMDIITVSIFAEPNEVSAVWGMSGVGKSFLVKHTCMKMICDDDTYWTRKMCGWVNVSHPLDPTDLSRRLLFDLDRPGYLQDSTMPTIEEDPIQACRRYLHEHECLIVIDGLQSKEEWDLTKSALELGTFRGGVIVVTNEESVAKYCATERDRVWNVKGLQIDHAVELYKKVQRRTDMLDEDEWRIIHKCGGLPKVICAAADIYDGFKGRELLKEDDNLVSVLEAKAQYYTTQSLEDLYAWLISYFRSCPDFLKPCILYVPIFSMNQNIRRRRLVRRWVAEGYVTAEEKGEEFFLKLVSLSMIHMPVVDFYSTPRMPMPLCQVNGFIREYIISRSMEENLVFALEGDSKRCSQRTGRHLAIYRSWDRDRFAFGRIDFSRLRSLTVFGEWRSFFISDKMRLLRVLDLEDVSSGVTNGDVEQMVKLLPRLKFLSLRRCTEITGLPDSLGDLRQLQTLDVRGTSVTKLPKSIVKLEKLQYIRAGSRVTLVPLPPASLPSCDDPSGIAETLPATSSPLPLLAGSTSRPRATLAPSWFPKMLFLRQQCRPADGDSRDGVKVPGGIGKLSSLQTLGVVNIGSAADEEAILDELQKLTQLRKLGVSGINGNNIRKLFSAISGVASLESLSLQMQPLVDEDNDNNQDADCFCCISEMESLRSLKLYGLTRKLRVRTKELRNLRKLSLQMTVLLPEGMDAITNLRELEKLSLFLSEFQDDKLELRSLDLDILEISCNSRLQATITCSPRLRISVLRLSCWGVSSLRVTGLEHIQCLKEVWLRGACDNDQKQHFAAALANYPKDDVLSKPVLMLEESAGSSTQWLMSSS